MTQTVLLLELNELNFELIERYAALGELPNFARLIARHGLLRTSSECEYEKLEPWIQWVTAHTGKSFDEHRIFRLGDAIYSDFDQLWEQLEREGFTVGAVSPMNAKNRLERGAFFLPDPWTSTGVTAPPIARRLHEAICQAVNDNAQQKITAKSAFWLLAGAVRFARPASYPLYLALAAASRGRPWRQAAFLDLLISELFIHLARKRRVDFASLFINGAAHVQHHYLHSSSALGSPVENPAWYSPPGVDPVLEIYRVYDAIVANVLASFPAARILLATGLHQEPCEGAVYYWRLKHHTPFLRGLGLEPAAVRPCMSRDFAVAFAGERETDGAAAILRGLRDADGVRLFQVDRREQDLFVTLTYPHEIDAGFIYFSGNAAFRGLKDDVAFVAIKNGEHDGVGYFLDTGHDARAPQPDFALHALPERIRALFGGDAPASV